jgi:hypothetical protein
MYQRNHLNKRNYSFAMIKKIQVNKFLIIRDKSIKVQIFTNRIVIIINMMINRSLMITKMSMDNNNIIHMLVYMVRWFLY